MMPLPVGFRSLDLGARSPRALNLKGFAEEIKKSGAICWINDWNIAEPIAESIAEPLLTFLFPGDKSKGSDFH